MRKIVASLTLISIAICLAGCSPSDLVAAIGRHFGTDLSNRVDLLPPPAAKTEPVIRGGSWCARMEAWGFPNKTGVNMRELIKHATREEKIIWNDFFDYGERVCGWRPAAPLVG